MLTTKIIAILLSQRDPQASRESGSPAVLHLKTTSLAGYFKLCHKMGVTAFSEGQGGRVCRRMGVTHMQEH